MNENRMDPDYATAVKDFASVVGSLIEKKSGATQTRTVRPTPKHPDGPGGFGLYPVLLTKEMVRVFFARSALGLKVTMEVKGPDAEGWYDPSFTLEDDGMRLVHKDYLPVEAGEKVEAPQDIVDLARRAIAMWEKGSLRDEEVAMNALKDALKSDYERRSK